MTVLLTPHRVTIWVRSDAGRDEHGWAKPASWSVGWEGPANLQERSVQADPTLESGGAGLYEPATAGDAVLYLPSDVTIRPGDVVEAHDDLTPWVVRGVRMVRSPLDGLALDHQAVTLGRADRGGEGNVPQ